MTALFAEGGLTGALRCGDVSVVICAYTEARWEDLVAAIRSVQQQSVQPLEIVVVIDHNPKLLARVHRQFSGINVIENSQQRGLSGARNSGIAVAQGEIIAFLDDDAQANPGWISQLLAGYADSNILGVGGTIAPAWAKERPRWFPSEFDWVVGCTYRGMPLQDLTVRNLIGCNMSFRRVVFDLIGGFRIGRVGALSIGQENDETELCIRLTKTMPQARLLYRPMALVTHRVHPNRTTATYFFKRCYSEGVSKALLTQLVGRQQSLATEQSYIVHTLPQGMLRGVAAAFRGDGMGFVRTATIVAGLAVTVFGYLRGSLVSYQQKQAKRVLSSTSALIANRPSVASGCVPHFWNYAGRFKCSFGGIPKEWDAPVASCDNFQPKRLFEVELSQPLPHISATDPTTGRSYRWGQALVRLHSQPLGVVAFALPVQGLGPDELAQVIWAAMGPQIVAHCHAEGLPSVHQLTAAGLATSGLPHTVQARNTLLENAPFASIVVATHNRTDSLPMALDSLLDQVYPHFEIVVVDNAPSNNATAKLIKTRYQQPRVNRSVRYAREERPGLAVAHNSGLQAVHGSIVAFTDDDVRADRYWLAELVRGFAGGDHVGCVTGMIVPAELETPAQGWSEQFGFHKGFTQHLFDLKQHRPTNPLHPYAAGTFGSGANMAFRTDVLRAMGGFDPALGAGSKALGGDDLEAFFQVIVQGYQLVYNPAAIVHHQHRRDYAGLRRQAYGYGVSLTAYLTKTIWERPTRLWDFVVRMPYGLFFAFSKQSPKHQKMGSDYPRELTLLEYKGMFYGPLAYLRSRWHTRRWRIEPSKVSSV